MPEWLWKYVTERSTGRDGDTYDNVYDDNNNNSNNNNNNYARKPTRTKENEEAKRKRDQFRDN